MLTMRTWIACAVAIAHLSGPVWALPDPFPPAEGSSAARPDADHGDRSANGAHLSMVDVELSERVLGGAARRPRRRRIQPRQSRAEPANPPGSEPPDIMLTPAIGRPLRRWKVPGALAGDGVWMECIYEYLRVNLRSVRHHMRAWELADAIVDCGQHHGRRFDGRWFDGMREPGIAQVVRSPRRATAWAEHADVNHGEEVRQAVTAPTGHFRDRIDPSPSPFSVAGIARVLPLPLPPTPPSPLPSLNWARKLGTGAAHSLALLFRARVPMPQLRRPAEDYARRLLRKEVPALLEREARVVRASY
ncbi:MAG: hypothetical protein M1826_002736 [Phylliscum demangeonii]|nr:MAG: hypothetical protein M1826_002736 [Phylliscum demangeonii]